MCVILDSPGPFELYISKAGMFDFGSTDPRNRHAKHTLEGNIPGWEVSFETHPYNSIMINV